MIIATDHFGTTMWTDVGGYWPIYTTPAGGGTYWSSSSRALANLTESTVDPDWLAAWMIAPGAPELLNTRSAFTGIDRVPPGHRLHLPISGTLLVERVWRPRAQVRDHVRALRHELTAAVAVRVDRAIAPTVDLSGGFDSTSLALLAAEHLHPDRSVTGVTLHPAGVKTGGDLSYATSAGKHPGISHRLMGLGPGHRPYSRLDLVPATDEPAPSTIAHAHFSAQLRWMKDEFNSDCHLTGDGGDSLLCAPPIMVAELLATGRYRRAIVEASRWAQFRQQAVWPLLRAAHKTSRETPANAFRRLARRLRSNHPGPPDLGVGWVPEATAPLWATRQAREQVACVAETAAEQSAAPFRGDFTTYVTAEIMGGVGRTARADAQLAEHYGISLHNPFVDSRVIDTYLAIPLRERPGPADYKPILRQALADLLPASLASRRTKGSFTTDFYQGMRANLSSLHQMTTGHLADMGLIDPTQLRRSITTVSAGAPTALSAIEPAIATEAWLSAIHATPAVEWAPTVASRRAQ